MSDHKKQHRQNTNPYNSGGGGFDVEDRYTALCMACWFSGVRPPGCVVPANHSLTSLAVQAPKEVWLFDDLILTFEGRGARKQIGISIKSGDYLKDGLPPKDLVEDTWRQALGVGVRVLADNDELVIAAPPLSPEHAKDWRELGEWARTQTDDALEANVAKANVGNDFKRSLVEAFRCPEGIAAGHALDQLRVGRVLRHLRLVEHDYRSPSDSRLVEEGIKRCSDALTDGSREHAERLWNHLLHIAEKIRPNAGNLTFERLLEYVRGEHRLAAHPDDAADWSLVDAETARRLDRVPDSIGGLKLPRESVVKQLRDVLAARSLVALVAESGEGKTVCAKRLADLVRAEKQRVVWLEPDQMCSPDGPGSKLGLSRSLENLLPRVVETSALLFADQVDQYDDVIDWFFDSVVERKKGDGRRPTVVRLAARLADELSASIPEDEVDPADGERVATLHADRVLRVQDGRLAFDHPLLADWSKRQYLVGRGNQVAAYLTSKNRRDNPAWHRGLTLYGLRLVEQERDVQAFTSLIALEPKGEATSCGDSLLATVMTATDPAAVLDTLWPALKQDDDLFQRILRVNHLAGTVPHPQMQKDNLRQPVSWHYPLIVQWLHAKQMDVIRIAPAEVALIAETWLRTAGQSSSLPARNDAAALALAIAAAARGEWLAERHRSHFRASRPAYQALFAAVTVEPDGALALIRRCAERIPDDQTVRTDRSSAQVAGLYGRSSETSVPSSPELRRMSCQGRPPTHPLKTVIYVKSVCS